jgi:hypothetical protein
MFSFARAGTRITAHGFIHGQSRPTHGVLHELAACFIVGGFFFKHSNEQDLHHTHDPKTKNQVQQEAQVEGRKRSTPREPTKSRLKIIEPNPSVDLGPTLELEQRDTMKAAGFTKFITWVKGLWRR